MPDICSVSNNNVKESGTIAFHLNTGKSRNRVNSGVLSDLIAIVLLGKTRIDNVEKSIQPDERKIVFTTFHRNQY